MGDVNQLMFVKSLAGQLAGPVLEVGSRDYGNTQNFRALFGEETEYLGIDMQAGKGVDVVLDLTEEFDVLDRRFEGRRFRTIICMSVLEHCRDPFRMVQNIERLLADDGTLVIGAPFVWELHGFPDDYWRFTPSGIRVFSLISIFLQYQVRRSPAARVILRRSTAICSASGLVRRMPTHAGSSDR